MTTMLFTPAPDSAGSDYEDRSARLLTEFFGSDDATSLDLDDVDSAALRNLLVSRATASWDSNDSVGAFTILVAGAAPHQLARLVKVPWEDTYSSESTVATVEYPTWDTGPVDLVAWLVSVTGLPESQIIRAAGVQRSFYGWKNGTTRTPRSQTLAKLWAMARWVRVMHENLGAELPVWMATDTQSRELFSEGRFREMANRSIEELAGRGLFRDPDEHADVRAGYPQVGFGDDGGRAPR